MKNLTTEFKRALAKNQRNYLAFADIKLSNNTRLSLTNTQLWSGGFLYEEIVSEDETFTALGSATIGTAKIIINNMTEAYSDYDFTNAVVELYLAMEFPYEDSTRQEKLKIGTYTVDETAYNGALITLTLLDNMEQFDRPYASNLTYPQTLYSIVLDACTKCSVTLNTHTFPHHDMIINTAPNTDSRTYRDVISWCATLAGCFAKCNPNGYLEFKWFDQNTLENQLAILDGGTSVPWSEGEENYSGGTVDPWSTGDTYTGGEGERTLPIHYVTNLYSQNIAVDDVVITGITAIVDGEDGADAQVFTHGTSGYVISIEGNNLITTDNAQTIVDYLGLQLEGLRFRKLNITHTNDPSIESGDIALVYDRKGRGYATLVTRVSFNIGSPQTLVCGASTPSRNNATTYSALTKSIVDARKLLKQQKTAWEHAIDQLGERLDDKAGLYCTVEAVEGGSGNIYYMHDQPTLADSSIVWKMNREAWGVTTNYDGDDTVWNAGMTVDGDAIARILSVIGINFDWGVGGKLTIKDENDNETLYVDSETGEVRIDATNVKIGGSTFNQKVQDIINSNDFDTDNLLIDSTNLSSDYWETSGTVDTGQTDPYGGSDAIKITPTSSEQGYLRAKRSNNNPYKTTSVWYRFSVWLKASSTPSSGESITLYLNNESYIITPTTSWKQYWIDKEVSTVSSSNNLTSIGGESSFTTADGYSLYVYNPRVFYTSKPETMREMFNRLTGNSQNQGLYIGTDSQGVDRAFVNLTYAKMGALSVTSNGNEILHVDAEDGSLAWSSTDSSMTKEGTLTCRNANITGVVTAGNGSQIGEMKAGVNSNVPCFYSGDRVNYNVNEQGICIESNGNFGASGNMAFWSTPGDQYSTKSSTLLQMLEWTNGGINNGAVGEDFVLRLSHGSDETDQVAMFTVDAVTGNVQSQGNIQAQGKIHAVGNLESQGRVDSNGITNHGTYKRGNRTAFNNRDQSGYMFDSDGLGGGTGTAYGLNAQWWQISNTGDMKCSGEIVSEKRKTNSDEIQGYVSIGQGHSNTATNNAICVYNGSAEKFNIKWDGSAFFSRLGSGFYTGIQQNFLGNVGINPQNPGVDGNYAFYIARYIGSSSGSYIFYIRWDGYTFAVTTNHTSDERYKNVVGLCNHKDLFMSLNPIEFTWKKDFVHDEYTHHIGVGAQTLKKQMEICHCENLGLVSYDEKNDTYAVNYTELLMLAVPVIQEHEEKIMKLEAENKELQKKIDNLEARIAKLEEVILNG